MATSYYADASQDTITLEELRLYHLIMEYRQGLSLPAIPMSLGLTITAARHTVDTVENLGAYPGHNWSDAPYDGANPSTYENMWLAPDRIGTSYQGAGFDFYGYEISGMYTGGAVATQTMTPEMALAGWQGSPPHNAVLTNTSFWTDPWLAIGIGLNKGVAHVWFGHTVDPGGPPLIVGTAAGETVNGTSFDDRIMGEGGADTLLGGAGFDTLIGGLGGDILNGGANPVNQGDFLLGGDGDDTYHVDSALDFVDEGSVFPQFGFGGFDKIISTADFYWDLYSVGERITIAGNAVDIGNDGTTIVAGVFNNEIVGNDGINILFGRGGSDVYRPGGGIDFMSFSTLGVPDAPGYTANGVNTLVMERGNSYDIVFEFEVGRDKVNLTDFDLASSVDLFSRGRNDGIGNSYFILGDGYDYLYLVGLELSELQAGDFIL